MNLPEPEYYKSMMDHAHRLNSIKDPLAFLRSTWDWDLFGRKGAKCFAATRINFTDLDMIVERNGYLLVNETKLPGKQSIDGGQLILFRRILWSCPSTIFIVWGEPAKKQVTRIEAWRKGPGSDQPARFSLLPSFGAWLHAISEWYEWANKMPIVEYHGPFWSFDRALKCRRLDLENAIPIEQQRYAI